MDHHAYLSRGQRIRAELGREQAHTARDIETNTARRNNTTLRDVGRSDPADGKTVTPVHIRQRIRRHHDAGEFRHVHHLLQGPVLGKVPDQRPGREHHTGHPHMPMPQDDETVRRLLNDLHRQAPHSGSLRGQPARDPGTANLAFRRALARLAGLFSASA